MSHTANLAMNSRRFKLWKDAMATSINVFISHCKNDKGKYEILNTLFVAVY